MQTIFKVFNEFVTILFLFMFQFFGHETCGILAPLPGIETTTPALEGSLNHWTARQVPKPYFIKTRCTQPHPLSVISMFLNSNHYATISGCLNFRHFQLTFCF